MSTFEPVVVIEALAGAGKTYKLSHRYLQLLEKGADPATILATTFSVKAAGEIKDRIIEFAALAVLHDDAREQLFEGVPEMDRTEEACVDLLRSIISNLHRLQIETIDSFFVKTARLFGEEIGFQPIWSILDELHEKTIMQQTVASMLSMQDPSEVAHTLRQASGSSTVPVAETIAKIQRFAYELLRQTSSESWLSGGDLTILSPKDVVEEISILESTESVNEKQLEKLQESVQRAKDGKWKQFLSTGLPKGMLDETYKFSRKDIEPELINALQPLFDHAGAILQKQVLDKNKGIVKLMTALNEVWSSIKHREGLYKFEDITYYLGAANVLDDLNELAFRIDSRVDHLLIDEFQDTSIPQWVILKPLIDEIYYATADRSLFFVGDPKQSLYGFRGGEPQLLQELPMHVGLDDPSRLLTSWRCSSAVLDVVNEVFEHAPQSELLKEHSTDGIDRWMQSFQTHFPAVPERLGFVAVHTTDLDMHAVKPHLPSLSCTIDKVSEIVSGIHKENPNASIGILVRKNTKQQIQRIVHALRTSTDYPVLASEFGGNPLTDSPPVTVILSALLFADHPGDTTSLFHISTSPIGESIGLHPTAKLKEAEVVSENLRKRLVLEGYASVINSLAKPLYKNASKRDRFRMWQLVELAQSYCDDESMRPSEFVSFVKKKRVADPATSKVQVMTVHASKGLGFDAVVVCDLDQELWSNPELLVLHDDPCEPPIRVSVRENSDFNSILPRQKEMWDECNSKQVQEALSLLYVAMTRAKHALHLVIPPRPLSETAATPTHSKAKTVDRFLRQVLGLDECLEPNSIVWQSELNNTNWFDEIENDGVEEEQKEFIPITFKEQENFTNVATTSPSSLEGGGKVKVGERFQGDTNTAFDWGTLVHKWFEDIEWIDTPPTVEILVATALKEQAGRLGSDAVLLAAESCVKALNSSDLQTLLTKPDENSTVFCEQEFVLRVAKGERFASVVMKETTDIRGSIDRLVVFFDDQGKPTHAEVIDWKSDSFTSEEIESKIEYYAPQLSSYRLAAAKLLGLGIDCITAKLVFISTQEVLDITDKT